MSPQRIQRSRAKGWRMPAGARYVGRPGPWGNPWRVTSTRGAWFVECPGEAPVQYGSRAEATRAAVDIFALWVGPLGSMELTDADLAPLRGRDLACWCPLEDEHGNRVPCHADVLLEIANRGDGQ